MSHLRSILFCTLLFMILTLRVSLASKITGIDVDKFLKKVLTSHKFDEIADKIAEKAVEKITNLNKNENSTIESAFNKKEPMYRVSEIASNNTDTINIPSKGHKRIRQSPTIQPVIFKSTVTEDVTSFSHEESAPADGLVLRFKHFTKQDEKHNQTFEEQNRKDTASEEVPFLQSEEHEDKPKQLRGKNQNNNVKENNIRDNASDANKDAYEYILSSSENVNQTTGVDIEEVVTTQNYTLKSRNNEENEHPDTKADSDEADSLNVEFEKNYKAYIEYQKQQKKLNSHAKNPIENQDSPSLEEEAEANLSQRSVEEKTTETTVAHTHLSETQEIEHEETTRTLVRQEGNKFYTYVKSPDYKDYHQKLSRMHKDISVQ